MTTPIHKADFSFIFSRSIGPPFSFNLCPSDLLLLLQPSGRKTTFLYFFFISIPSPFTSWLNILFLMISYCFCCGFFCLFYYKSEENTAEYICMASAVFHSNSSLYCQRFIAGDSVCSSQSGDFRSLCFPDSGMGRRKYLPLHSWMSAKSFKRTMKSKI